MNVFFVFAAMLEFAIVNTVMRRAVRSRVRRQLAASPRQNSIKAVRSKAHPTLQVMFMLFHRLLFHRRRLFLTRRRC